MKKLGPVYADVAASYSKLGLVHRQLGDLKQAKDCHKRALDVYTENLGHEHEKSQHLAIKQTKDCHKRSPDVYMKKYGPDRINVAASYHALGLVQRQLGVLNQAKYCHGQALDVYLKKLGPEHVYVATCYDNLGF